MSFQNIPYNYQSKRFYRMHSDNKRNISTHWIVRNLIYPAIGLYFVIINGVK